jgi:DNA-binding NarL/FixJ family response regulator
MSEFYKDLTNKEKEVLNVVVNNIEGLKNEELAKKLNITRATFCTHLINIYYKTRTNSQIELIIRYYKERIDANNRNN